jgi:rhomboid protease GluP
MEVTSVVHCREEDRPPESAVAVTRAHLTSAKEADAREAAMGAAQRAVQKAHGEPTTTPIVHKEIVEFQHTLEDLTPSAYVTNALVGVNLAIFVLMVISGVSLGTPSTADLLNWGAEYGPRTLHGEWWRLFTSMFVHIGLMHVAYNMLAFAYVGPIVERMLGNIGFLVLYLVAGLGGSLLALYTDALVLHAGASGAVFGVYGALLAQIVKQGRSMPPHVVSQLGRLGMIFVLYNLINSFAPGISMAAHIGGLVTGFVCGLVLAEPLSRDALVERPVRAMMALVLGVVMLFGGVFGAQARYPELDRLQQLQDQFTKLDKKDSKVFDGVKYQSDRKGMSDEEFADFVERDVLPEWHGMREQVAAYRPVPRPYAGRVEEILDYMRLRQDSCELIVAGLREHNEQEIKQAAERHDQAREVAQWIR